MSARSNLVVPRHGALPAHRPRAGHRVRSRDRPDRLRRRLPIGNETPNIVYELLLGGVLSATLVPLFTSFVENDDEEATNVVITVTPSLLAVVTVVAVLAAPLIFGSTRCRRRRRRRRPVPRGGHAAHADLPDPDLLLRRAALANALLNSRRRVLRRSVEPDPAQPDHHRAAVAARRRQAAERTLDDVLTDDRLRWTLGLGATGGIAAMALVLIPRCGGPVCTSGPGSTCATRRCAGLLVAVGLDARLRRRQPGRSDRGPQPRRSRVGRRQRLLRRLHVLRAPHGLLAVSIATTFVPEMARSVARQDRASSFAPDVARHAADRAAHAAGRRSGSSCSAARSSALLLAARRVHGRRGQHAGRSPASPSASSGSRSTCSSLRLLRPPGHAHAVRHQPRPERSTSCSHRPRRPLRHPRPGPPSPSPTSSAVWALQILSYKVPGFPLRDGAREPLADVWRPRRSRRGVWLVATLVGGDTGGGGVVRVVGGGRRIAVYAGVLLALRTPSCAALRAAVRPSGGDLSRRLRPCSSSSRSGGST